MSSTSSSLQAQLRFELKNISSSNQFLSEAAQRELAEEKESSIEKQLQKMFLELFRSVSNEDHKDHKQQFSKDFSRATSIYLHGECMYAREGENILHIEGVIESVEITRDSKDEEEERKDSFIEVVKRPITSEDTSEDKEKYMGNFLKRFVESLRFPYALNQGCLSTVPFILERFFSTQKPLCVADDISESHFLPERLLHVKAMSYQRQKKCCCLEYNQNYAIRIINKQGEEIKTNSLIKVKKIISVDLSDSNNPTIDYSMEFSFDKNIYKYTGPKENKYIAISYQEPPNMFLRVLERGSSAFYSYAIRLPIDVVANLSISGLQFNLAEDESAVVAEDADQSPRLRMLEGSLLI
ncbi:MAG: hypothetical protein ACKOAD_05150 [Gammaproteobacteria bacterium]